MSIFSSLIPQAHLNHNVFDISKRSVFSMKAGMLQPCFVQHTVPNATYEIDVANSIELSPMQTANFARMSQNIEYYFVPYSQLWRWFEPFYYGRLDTVRNPSNVLNPTVPKNVPYFNLKELYSYLWNCYYVFRLFTDILTVNPLWQKYYSQGIPTSEEGSSYYNFFADIAHDSGDHPVWLVNACHMITENMIDVHGRPCVDDVLRNLDLLGYGNLLPQLKKSYLNVVHLEGNATYDEVLEFFAGLSYPAEGGLDELFDSFLTSIVSTYNPYSTDYNIHHSEMPEKKVPAFSILAYLKIFSDNFRSTQYDDTNYSYYYNLDHMLATIDGVVGEIDVDVILFCLNPRYRLYRRDILTGTYPNAQFGDVAVANAVDSIYNIKLFEPDSADIDDSPIVSQNGLSGQSGAHGWKLSPTPMVSALAIRQAEALQRYKEKNLRAGNKLVNQQKAMFGDRSKFLEDDYSLFLGSVDSDILINEIPATSESGDFVVGEKASNGSSALNKNVFRFESHDFGVIIGLMYILPRADYQSIGLDPMNTKLEQGDFFNENFQNLGLAPVFSDIVDPSVESSVLGYSSRYWEYKTALDHVHGEFCEEGVFEDYVTPRSSHDFEQPKLQSLYVSPNDVDRIFYRSADFLQSSDQFKVNMYHQVKGVLPMSVTGLPY